MTVLLLVFFGDNEEACCSLVVFSLCDKAHANEQLARCY